MSRHERGAYHPRSYPTQAILVSEGGDSDSLYLILAGRWSV